MIRNGGYSDDFVAAVNTGLREYRAPGHHAQSSP